MERINIEDAEGNFLYLYVDLPRSELEPVIEALNRYSNGTARIEPPMSDEDQELARLAFEEGQPD